MARTPVVSGKFYEDDFGRLNKQIEDCFYSDRGPGDLPIKRTQRKIRGIITPHAGYEFSGQCAAWAYKEIAESKLPRAYVILGVNHYGDETGMSLEDWKTPFGLIRTDKDLIMEIKEKTDLDVKEEIHMNEHSIEVQLPFLQFASRDKMAEIRIVPIMIGREWRYTDIAKGLHEVLKDKDVVYIVSSDFTHYGPAYHYLPFTLDVPQRLNALDKGAIEAISRIDSKAFKNYMNETGITICGYMPILVFLAIMEQEAVKPTAELLMHYLSGDIVKEYKNSVSYVSMAFR